MFSSLKIGLVLVMLASAGGAYLYVQKLQKDNAILKTNQVKLEIAVEESNQVIEQQTKDLKQIRSTLTKIDEENAKLKTLLTNHQNFFDSTFIHNKKFKYIAAKVIKNSIKKRNNYLTINKGIKDGVRSGMGVVTSQGVIGIVHSVSQNYSLIISLLHHKSATGIFLKKNMHTGILKWNGFNYRIATINDLPVHVPINIGDTIITNSYSNIYPEGISIGTIANLNKNDDGFYNINVKLLEDFNNLRYVYVVHSPQSNEQLQLEKINRNE